MQALSLADIRYSWDRDQHYLLDGIIEMDEAYLGASKHGKKRGRSTDQRKMPLWCQKITPVFRSLRMSRIFQILKQPPCKMWLTAM